MSRVSFPFPRQRLLSRAAILSGASLFCLSLMGAPLTAQEAVEASDDYVADSVTASEPAAPLANTVSEAETVLPPSTPAYFKPVYPHMLKAPRPARTYLQGGIPALIPQLQVDRNPFGRLGTYLPGGPVYTADNAFFQDLVKLNTGYTVNGRSCATCHQPPSGMSISLRNIKARFNVSKGTDPLFAPVDGANCPDAVPAKNTAGSLYGGLKGKGRKALKDAHSLLLTKGLIRIPMPWPPANNPEPEFDIEIVSDAPGCNTSKDFGIDSGFVSVYRRPIISAHLNFKTVRQTGARGEPVLPGSVMWDGREPSLEQQAVDATRGHAQSPVDPTPEQVDEIVAFENFVFSAQLLDKQAGRLDAAGATGGPVNLAAQPVVPNPPFPFIPFDEYNAWNTQAGERLSIQRGQDIFNNRTLLVAGVRGFNDAFPPGFPSPFPATCGTCHNVPNAGADVIPNPQRGLGVGGTGEAFAGPAPTTDLPVFRLTCHADAPAHPFVGRGPVETNDPGLALLTGKCADIGSFTVPQLRALAAREPYFHDGFAKDLNGVVDFYATRFQFAPPLSGSEKTDLVNFLSAL